MHAFRLARHELYCRKDAASLYLERGAPGDDARATEEFAAALELAASLAPPQPLVLMQLAESVLSTPALVGRPTLPAKLRKTLSSALRAAKDAATLGLYQRRERARAFDLAVDRLRAKDVQAAFRRRRPGSAGER